MKATLCTILMLLLGSISSSAAERKVNKVMIVKSQNKMVLLSGSKKIKEYHVVFGANPNGHKQQEGDEKTPEGDYILDYKKSDSSYYKAIHISYPNKMDILTARNQGVNPGGMIMIHGQKNGLGWLAPFTQNFNWTDGCVALTNSDMEEVWQLIKKGTKIVILP